MKNFLKGKKMMAAGLAAAFIALMGLTACGDNGGNSGNSGNGGGYVFDCRGVHNPGRYIQYKLSTGLDKNVIDFLESDGEILKFLDNVYALADAHVARFIERGFTNLMFCFGCTGGQHRSVYSAQHTAEHIAKKFGIEVEIIHREREIREVLNPSQKQE